MESTTDLRNGVLELETAIDTDEVMRRAWFVADFGENCCLAAIRLGCDQDVTSVVLTAADVFAGCRSALEAAEGFDPLTAMTDRRPAYSAPTADELSGAAAALSTVCTKQAPHAAAPADAMALWAVAGMAYAATVALSKVNSDAPLGR